MIHPDPLHLAAVPWVQPHLKQKMGSEITIKCLQVNNIMLLLNKKQSQS